MRHRPSPWRSPSRDAASLVGSGVAADGGIRGQRSEMFRSLCYPPGWPAATPMQRVRPAVPCDERPFLFQTVREREGSSCRFSRTERRGMCPGSLENTTPSRWSTPRGRETAAFRLAGTAYGFLDFECKMPADRDGARWLGAATPQPFACSRVRLAGQCARQTRAPFAREGKSHRTELGGGISAAVSPVCAKYSQQRPTTERKKTAQVRES